MLPTVRTVAEQVTVPVTAKLSVFYTGLPNFATSEANLPPLVAAAVDTRRCESPSSKRAKHETIEEDEERQRITIRADALPRWHLCSHHVE